MGFRSSYRGRKPAPPPAPSDSFAWAFADGATLDTGRNATTLLATGVPGGAVYSASPDLMPGQTLQLSGTQLNLVGDSTVPTTHGVIAGSLLDAVAERDVVIEVLENPVATIVNITRGTTYLPNTDYTGRTGSYGAGRWNAVMHEASANDIIEVAPGAIMSPGNEAPNYYSTNLDSTVMAVWKPVTIRGMAGRGRWRMYPTRQFMDHDRNGITIYSPIEIGVRGSFTISDFVLDDWGRYGGSFGIRVRDDKFVTSTWADYHASLTLQNFKIWKPPYERSASGVSGTVETALFDGGHVYDTGAAAGAADGRDHNFYFGARYLTMRGVRSSRTRGNSATGWWEPGGAGTDMDGHLAKLSFIEGTFEGCVFDGQPRADNSIGLQCYGGGVVVIRGCLFVGCPHPQSTQGLVVMCRETQGGGPPNYTGWWDSYRPGNSLLVERSVFVSHGSQKTIGFFPLGHYDAIQPGTGPTQISSVVVRDNIGISNVASSSDWIANDPTGGAAWVPRGNTARAYNLGEWAFRDREVMGYTDALGADAASTGAQVVPQFLWPHGYRNVTRSTRGLG